MDCSPPGSSIHGILQVRMLEWTAISFSRGSSRPWDQTQVSHIAGQRFNLWATREALSHFSRVQFFVTLWTAACQAPQSMGFSWQEYWSGLLWPPQWDLPDPGTEFASRVSPTLQVDSLSTESAGKPKLSGATTQISIHLFNKQVMSTYDVPNSADWAANYVSSMEHLFQHKIEERDK